MGRTRGRGGVRAAVLVSTGLSLVLAMGGVRAAEAQQAPPKVPEAGAPTVDPSAQPTPTAPSPETAQGTPSSPVAPETQGADVQPLATDKNAGGNEVSAVVVTATGTNITGVKPVGSETVSLDRQQILATGAVDINQALQTVPQIQNNPEPGGQVFRQGGTSGYGTGAGTNSTQGTSNNLRGLGAQATLTLVDGRRLAPSGASNAFTEAVQVPIAALQRVEIVSDGASAVYGSDAVAGVINYVLRKDFNGLEIAPRDQASDHYNEWGVSVTGGHTWSSLGPLGGGSLVLTYDHDHRDPYHAYDSPFLRQNLSGFGGPDLRAFNGAATSAQPVLIANVNNGGTYNYYGVPVNAAPGTTFAQLGSPVLYDAAQYQWYLGRQDRDQVAMFLNQDLTPWLSVFYEGFYTHRMTVSQGYDNTNMGNNITVNPGTPYYITGVPGVTGAETVATVAPAYYNGLTYTVNPDTTFTNTFGADVRLPFGWKSEAYFTWGSDRTCGICNFGNNPNLPSLQQQVNAGAISPYLTSPPNAMQLSTYMGDNYQYARNILLDGEAKFDGPLFRLPGGLVRAAVGAEWNYNEQALENVSNNNNTLNTDNTTNVNNVVSVNRTDVSGFAEVFVPVVGSENALPFVRSLSIDAAVRYDHYSDFGGTTNPKVGGTWAVNEDLSLRASWGTSFRAPFLTDTNPRNFSFGVAAIPVVNNSGLSGVGFSAIPFSGPNTSLEYLIGGANPDLQPETATTWSTGFDLQPHQIRGLKLSFTYYSVTYQNQIAGPQTGLFLSSPQYAALYSKYIIPVHNPATCVEGDPATYDPVFAKFLADHPALYGNTAAIPSTLGGGYCGVNVILDSRTTNLGSTFQDGLDLQANYNIETRYGRWAVGASVTDILNDTQTPVPGGGEVSVLNTYNYPVSLRSRGQIGWAKGPFSATVFVNYVGSYLNTFPLPNTPSSKVPAWTTADLNLNYQVPKDSRLAWMRGLRASLNIINFTDEDPPLVLTDNNNSYFAFDPNNANVFGRQFSFTLVKPF